MEDVDDKFLFPLLNLGAVFKNSTLGNSATFDNKVSYNNRNDV